ncbi:MAG: M4 family metallopeptidase [Nocardioides sp.]
MAPARVLGPGLLSAALVFGSLAVLGTPADAADPAGQALTRLDADADGALTIRRDDSGVVDFVGVPARTEVDNPAVPSTSMSVTAAADAHLARYGAALGSHESGTTLARTDVAKTVIGQVVRYQQHVDGVPVLGGQVVVNLDAGRELSSILAEMSDATSVGAATISESAAQAVARAAFVKAEGGDGKVSADSDGRWVLDADLIGGDGSLPDRTVWRFEVTRAADERREILVDDRTGSVLMNTDLIAHANRVVCDNDNEAAWRGDWTHPVPPCLAGFEGGAPSAVADVNAAYDLSGVVADFYQEVAGIDVAQLVGVTTSGGKKLASTVNWCIIHDAPCPYANSFWNGSQMVYGQGYARADDIVGHEITHGFTERSSGLFYWGQSGAINESISDIIGEIVDHRHPTAGDSPTNWALGEDLPGLPNGIRNLQDPTLFGDPDATTSSLYEPPDMTPFFYRDRDGVHTNSGVGNKTFYLASQGGTFNGQTITGIDASDPTLDRSAKLWLLVEQSLSSGSDYADLGVVLDQSCQALLATPGSGFSPTNCDNVHAATLATRLSQTPTRNPQPADAAATCPTGTVKRVLLESETGVPTAKFVTAAGSTWSRDGVPGWGQVAYSNPAAWASSNPGSVGSSSLVAANGIAVPAGQQTYLWFQHWRLLDYVETNFFDGGAVEIDHAGGRDGTADLPWVNGPMQTMDANEHSPIAGQKAFGGDSRGYVASRVDLSSYAAQTIKPVFTLHSDRWLGQIGWFVDDITVYTCDTAVRNASRPTVAGTPKVGKPLTAAPGAWTPSGVAFSYRWLRNGSAIAGANAATYVPGASDRGTRLSVRVTGTWSGLASDTATSASTPAVAAGKLVKGKPTMTGKAKVGAMLTAKPGVWKPGRVSVKYQWLRNGKPIKKATAATYRLGTGDQGKRISVRVTGSKPGYATAKATSKPSGKVKAK